MRLLDYFFYVLTQCQINARGSEEDSRFTSSMLLGLWVAFVSLIPISYIEKLYTNKLTNSIINDSLIFSVFGVVCAFIIFIRYFRYIEYASIVRWRESFSPTKSKIMYLMYLILFWGLPITAFCVYRICRYGQVKWW